MGELNITDLAVRISGQSTNIIDGLNLTVKSGEIHALMGPNGSGKSSLAHALMGKAGYEIVRGSVKIDGIEISDIPTHQRAGMGLFVGQQYPTEVPGVGIADFMAAAVGGQGRDPGQVGEKIGDLSTNFGVRDWFLDRPVNFDMSGGEKKLSEVIQLSVLEPKFAILDELDSGLDVDALRLLSRAVSDQVRRTRVGILAITHYTRLLEHLKPDFVHVFTNGAIIESGGRDLAEKLDVSGYEKFVTHH